MFFSLAASSTITCNLLYFSLINTSNSLAHLSMHEEAQCERDSHGAVSKLLFTAHGRGGGGVVGEGVGGLCCWETHEGLRPRGVWSSTEHHREPFGEPRKEPSESPGAARGGRGGRGLGSDGGAVWAELASGWDLSLLRFLWKERQESDV